MDRKRTLRVMGVALALGMMLVLAGCASQAQAKGRPGPGEGNEVMGLFSSATEDALVIELIDRQGAMGGERPEGDAPPEGEWPDGPPEGGEGAPPEGRQPPDGASFPAGGGVPPAEDIETTGETKEIKLTADTAITVVGSNDSLTLGELAQGEMLRVTLGEDGTTATSITVMRQMEGEQGE